MLLKISAITIQHWTLQLWGLRIWKSKPTAIVLRSQTCQLQSGRNRDLYFTKLWDFVKNREISETSKVVLLLWIKCIKKSVLYLASRILIVEICLCWTYSSYVLCLILEILEQNSVSWSFHWKLSAMFLQNKWKQELHYLLYMAINTL
jgi:hypothetical protein